MKNSYNLRSIAAKAISQVLDQGQSLSAILPDYQRDINPKDKALLQELCFGVMRVLPELEWYSQQLMAKPLTGKQRVLHYLILTGLYQLRYTRIPPHAALSETVNGAVVLKKPQLKGLINGVLRQFQRQEPQLAERFANSESRWLHPKWLLSRIQAAYPDKWESVITANNEKPPMWLRINRNYHSAPAYQALLAEAGIESFYNPAYPDALRLAMPCPVTDLPGFAEGWATVQDSSAQGCALLLAPQDDETVLDLCAAPGGKTTHILEIAPRAHVMAVDVDKQRLTRVNENLQRLKQHAIIKIGDGRYPEQWAESQMFDRILLDAPCSATGVIRRHPDIKWLRRDSDIDELATLQREILEAIWPYLKPGGTMVYATCSVLPEENIHQVNHFLSVHSDAILTDTPVSGYQMLPDAQSGDGFFYAKLTKRS
ncbi:16S rRNA (cytosine(967)-C(5))-methyltransferase RsmB [Morganella psychrotolerans]|uniref:Ribosomal RNA small subunit methyltransferase B n=1 Tax=Morganella psychrotolerans TaxID=368603 RepID=A0A1B8HC57_9GAMM|nr:16S rRNA (cytosine(967)-C(5))-methyltransferase RsmB [Morganella psychrotolerans]OBU06679.1 16S rRNA (cytosine(967)-C(5))-methyltransferase [Morganella psychrotolerans]